MTSGSLIESAAAQNASLVPSPLILLDIDDVLCLESPCGSFDAVAAVRGRHVNPAAVYGQLFAPGAVSALRLVHDAMAGTPRWVITSTWRELLSRQELCAIFRHTGLDFVADRLHEGERWCTPPKFGRRRRVDEITEWLNRYHQGEPFAIIDDTLSGASLVSVLGPSPHPFASRVVLCRENVGLTADHVRPILQALRRSLAACGLAASATGAAR